MQTIYPALRETGTEVLAVSFAPPDRVAGFLVDYPLPFPVVSDPDRTAYRTFGLERATLGTFLRPSVLARYLGWVVRGWRPRASAPGDDVFQLGGDFVLDAAGRVRFAHASVEPTDRPTASALLNAVRAAG